MKNGKVHVVTIVVVLVAVVTFVSLSARSSSRGVVVQSKTESTVKPTSRVTDRTTSTSAKASTAAFAAAASQNAALRNELTWTFGGKQQRGWSLYELLINKTLKTQEDAATSDFASAVAAWQKRSGLSADGVIDEDALMRFVSQWQSNRLKVRTAATPDQLLTAPATDFFDPSRAEELRQVERNTYAAYKRMIAAALADPALKLARSSAGELAPGEKYFKIISAFRSREYQDELRRRSPNAGSAGLAVNSPHFTGRALDIYVGGDPVDTKDSNRAIQVDTPAYRWLVRNAERFGFRPYFYEPWHWEYVG
ncbi:MAG TPA: D-alanyl-D-alanine carboxypeptidase family protein [Pyrinomonadaceae bacterium]|nr:D-alanyl-D-alanine carboxypeptidase family protein [Pyrinomonadaceae bacterium]